LHGLEVKGQDHAGHHNALSSWTVCCINFILVTNIS